MRTIQETKPFEKRDLNINRSSTASATDSKQKMPFRIFEATTPVKNTDNTADLSYEKGLYNNYL
jgi:hypothetical protein